MVNLYDFITRDLGTNKSHVFSVKSADLDNALASLELQYEASVGSYAACEIMNAFHRSLGNHLWCYLLGRLLHALKE